MMKKLTIVGMMVVACFTQAMENDEKKKFHKKTYSAAVRGIRPKRFTPNELSEIKKMMQLDEACHYTYLPKPQLPQQSSRNVHQEVVLEGSTLTNFKIIFDATGKCTILDKKGHLIGKYTSMPSALPSAPLKKIQNLLAQQQITSKPHILKRSQSAPNLIVAALSSELEKKSAQNEKYILVHSKILRSKTKTNLLSTLAEGSPSIASTSDSSTSSSNSPSLLQVTQAPATLQPEKQVVVATPQQAKTSWWPW